MEVGKEEHPYADNEGHRRAVVQRLAGAVHAAGTVVLGHKGRDRLHEGRGDQHDKGADFLGHAHACRRRNAHGVDDGQYNRERHADQQVLQGNGRTQPGHAAQGLAVDADVGAVHLKGQLLFADDRQRHHHADHLGRHSGDGRTRRAQAQPGAKQQVARNVAYAGNGLASVCQ